MPRRESSVKPADGGRCAYGGDGAEFSEVAEAKIAKYQADPAMRSLPICMSKTQYSLTDDPTKLGARRTNVDPHQLSHYATGIAANYVTFRRAEGVPRQREGRVRLCGRWVHRRQPRRDLVHARSASIAHAATLPTSRDICHVSINTPVATCRRSPDQTCVLQDRPRPRRPDHATCCRPVLER